MIGIFFKRVIDIIVSIAMMMMLSPLFIIVSIMVKATSRGKVIFRQKRVGKDGKPFVIYKFRTMKEQTPELATADFFDSDTYLTVVGNFLRKTSIDELPQLYNVLIGNMTLVGPRPSLLTEDEMNHLRQADGTVRLKPGITGWAQINGRDFITNQKKQS